MYDVLVDSSVLLVVVSNFGIGNALVGAWLSACDLRTSAYLMAEILAMKTINSNFLKNLIHLSVTYI